MNNKRANNTDNKIMSIEVLLSHVFERGQKVYIEPEKRPYKVRTHDDRFVICTKPFNLQKTVLYFIIDKKREVRGAENLIFGMGFETDKQCEEALERLQQGKSEVSYRNVVKLDIVRIETFNK